jgi:hypothetical protein
LTERVSGPTLDAKTPSLATISMGLPKADIRARVFFSHSHVNRATATDLQKVIERYASTYLDQDRIQVGDVLPERIREGIEWCTAFLLIWSKDAARSRWVENEWRMARGLPRTIVPYVLDPEPLPPDLADLVYVNWQDSQLGYGALLKAVIGPDFFPSQPRPFPGRWRVVLEIPGIGSATYVLDLRRNGQITGRGGIDAAGPFGQMLAGAGLADFLAFELDVRGAWQYDEGSRLLLLEMSANGMGRTFDETLRIRIDLPATGPIQGRDPGGRSYVITRLAEGSIRRLLTELTTVLGGLADWGRPLSEAVAAGEAAVALMAKLQAERASVAVGSDLSRRLGKLIDGLAEVKRQVSAPQPSPAALVVLQGVGHVLLKQAEDLLQALAD